MTSANGAAALAMALILAGGVGYRAAAARLGRNLSSVPMPMGTLAQLPNSFEGWEGKEFLLDEKLIRATDTDDHVCRQFAPHGGLPGAVLFVGYGINLRDLTPHRPEVCYVSQGWTQVAMDRVELVLAHGDKLPCQVFRFRKGDLSPRLAVVLHYYIADGRRGPDVNWLRSAALRGSKQAHYAARVQIECQAPEGSGGVELALKSVQRLAQLSADPILMLMPESGEASAQTVHPGGAPAP